jgi:hypothetical protein
MPLRGLKWRDLEHVVDDGQSLAEPVVYLLAHTHHLEYKSVPSLDHLQECSDGGHSCDDMSSPGPRIGNSDDRPREGEEFIEGRKEMSPRTLIPEDRRESKATASPWSTHQGML